MLYTLRRSKRSESRSGLFERCRLPSWRLDFFFFFCARGVDTVGQRTLVMYWYVRQTNKHTHTHTAIPEKRGLRYFSECFLEPDVVAGSGSSVRTDFIILVAVAVVASSRRSFVHRGTCVTPFRRDTSLTASRGAMNSQHT